MLLLIYNGYWFQKSKIIKNLQQMKERNLSSQKRCQSKTKNSNQKKINNNMANNKKNLIKRRPIKNMVKSINSLNLKKLTTNMAKSNNSSIPKRLKMKMVKNSNNLILRRMETNTERNNNSTSKTKRWEMNTDMSKLLKEVFLETSTAITIRINTEISKK